MPYIVRRPRQSHSSDEDGEILRKLEDEVMPRYYEIGRMDLDSINDGIFKETLQDAYYTIWTLVDIIHRLRGDR